MPSADIVTVLVILVAAFICFARELFPVDVVGALIVLALVATGLLGVPDALEGFGHPAVIGVGALFVVSEGLLKTGALGFVANRLERWSRGSETRLLLYLLLTVAASSAFLNNTPIVAMFIPVVLGVATRVGVNPSKLLIPLSYAAILGGTCTMIGTSTNLLVTATVASALADNSDLNVRVPSMFEFAKLGVVVTVAGLAYLLTLGRHLIPERQTITSMTSGDRRLTEYVTELGIRPCGKLVGTAFRDSVLSQNPAVRILQIIRGESILWPPFDALALEDGDALVISGKIEDILRLQNEDGLQTLDEIISDADIDVTSLETELAELLIQPNSVYIGQRLEEARFRSRFNVNVLAIQRHGMHLRRKISQHPLKVGDLLLVQGTHRALQRFRGESGVVLMSGVEDVVIRRDKAPVAIAVLAMTVLGLCVFPHAMAAVALAGAVSMVVTGCLSAGKVYESVHWRILVLIAGSLALGAALQSTKAAAWLAGGFVGVTDHPRVLLAMTLVVTTLLTECVSNNAVAAIMIPIALELAVKLDVSATPFVMAIAFGASCSFLTPIGYQTNTLVYGAGGYRFGDFFRVGLPLVLVVWAFGTLLLPVLWPL